MSFAIKSLKNEPFLTGVQLIESDTEIEEVSQQVSHWRGKVVSVISSTQSRSAQMGALKDLLYVVNDFEEILPNIQLREWSVLVAKDNEKKIQSVAIFQFRKSHLDFTKQDLFVQILASAPWNIKSLSSISFEEPTVSGGGIMLMHALDSIGRDHSSCQGIFLHATGTGFGFYKRIGMHQHMLNSFFLDFSKPRQKEDLDKALSSCFGEHFSYSME